MTRREALVELTTGAAMLTLGGCLFRPVHSFRFRVTVEVDTPEGLKSGSSVMEMSLSQGMAVGDSSGVSSGLIGEAVAVDLPSGSLFMLLEDVKARGGIQANVVRSFFPGVVGPASVDAADTLGRRSQRGRKTELPKAYYPTFVRFDDRLRPETVQEINPDGVVLAHNNYGKVRAILLEITGDSITKTLDSQLPWIIKDRGSLIPIPKGPVRFEREFGHSVHLGYLCRGIHYE